MQSQYNMQEAESFGGYLLLSPEDNTLNSMVGPPYVTVSFGLSRYVLFLHPFVSLVRAIINLSNSLFIPSPKVLRFLSRFQYVLMLVWKPVTLHERGFFI